MGHKDGVPSSWHQPGSTLVVAGNYRVESTETRFFPPMLFHVVKQVNSFLKVNTRTDVVAQFLRSK